MFNQPIRQHFDFRGRLVRRGLLLFAFLILLLPLSCGAADLTCTRLPVLMKSFLSKHYAMKTMTVEIKAHAADQMIKAMDPSKTLLYESDVEKLKSALQGMFASMQSGNCVSLKDVYKVLVARAHENEDMVRKILGPDYKLDESVELNTDVNKRPYVQTPEQKQALLKKVVQFQLENLLATGIALEEAKKQQIHRYELQTRRITEADPQKLLTDFAESFALALDPHSSYLSPENLEDLQIQMQLSLEGIGASLSSDNGFTVIEELIPGGSAERSGRLKPKDKIIAVAQEGEKSVNIIDMDLREIIKMIRGKKGTKVTLTILRQAERTERFDVTITRDKIDIKEQEAKITYETRTAGGKTYRFGIIDLPSFYGDENENKSCYADVKRLLAQAKKRSVNGIVLDLSRNRGGLLTEAVQLSGLFIGNGAIVATKSSNDQVTILANGEPDAKGGPNSDVMSFPEENQGALYVGPLVVLTSRMSASASEIVAGALKDYRRAVIVGSDHTFGKGSVQQLSTLLWDLGAMKVTTGLYFLPGGKSTQKTGVEADVQLPNWALLEEIGEAEMDYPLPAQSISPFISPAGSGKGLWRPLSKPLIKKLAERSKARVDKNDKFIDIVNKNKEAASRKGIVRLADLRKELQQENGGKKMKESPAELRKKAQEQQAPFVKESVNVLLDVVTLAQTPRSADKTH